MTVDPRVHGERHNPPRKEEHTGADGLGRMGLSGSRRTPSHGPGLSGISLYSPWDFALT